jgi:hypothetical protein
MSANKSLKPFPGLIRRASNGAGGETVSDDLLAQLPRPPLRDPHPSACGDRLFHDIALRAVDKSQHRSSLCRGDPEIVERGFEVADESLPIALGNPHTPVRHLHVTADVYSGPPADAQRKLISNCFSRRMLSSARCCQNRASWASARNRINRSSATAAIAFRLRRSDLLLSPELRRHRRPGRFLA